MLASETVDPQAESRDPSVATSTSLKPEAAVHR
jgi:hypothetical protein